MHADQGHEMMSEISPLREGEGDSTGAGAPSGVPPPRDQRLKPVHRLQATASAVAERLQRLSPGAFNISALLSLASLYIGYSLGSSSSAFLYFERTSSEQVLKKEYFLLTLQLSAAVGALLAGWSADVIGRRASLGATSLLGVLGAMVASAATLPPTLLLSQLASGLALGAALVLGPVYGTELAPGSHRGLLLSIPEVGVSAGLALAYLAAYLCEANWRRMLGLGALPAAALGGAALLLLPDSPRWLAQVGRVRDAMAALTQVEEREDVAALVLEEILGASGQGGPDGPHFGALPSRDRDPHPQASLASPHGHQGFGFPGSPPHHTPATGSGAGPGAGSKARGGLLGSVGAAVGRSLRPWREVLRLSEALLPLLMLSLGMAFYQQATGMDATLAYLPEILAVAGLSSRGAELAASLALAGSRAAAAILAGALVDEVGRRPLLLMSAGGSAAALLGQGVVLQVLGSGQGLSDDANQESLSSWVHPRRAGAAVFAIIGVCNFAAFFSLGLGPFVPLVGAESCPLRVRAAATGLATAAGRLTAALLVFNLVPLADATSAGVPYFAFAAASAAAVAFLGLSVKELKGTSLEQASAGSSSSRDQGPFLDQDPFLTQGGAGMISMGMAPHFTGEWGPGAVARRARIPSMEGVGPL